MVVVRNLSLKYKNYYETSYKFISKELLSYKHDFGT